jgi:ribonuclease P/MRP protein subunit POP1
MNRFRLTGSHSNAVLSKAFNVSSPSGSNWLQQIFSENEKSQKVHEAQKELWKKFRSTTSPLELPLHCVINLNVDDPRTNRNTSKREIKNDFVPFSNGSQEFEVTQEVSSSFLWDKELRDNITVSRMTNSELDKLRYKKQLIPAIPTSFEKSVLQPIPILIIQQPNELMSGFDIIIPSGYGLTVWLSLIKFGAKAGGWREYEMILSEMGKNIFAPDSVAGIKESENRMEELKNDYFRKPPNKRTNFAKLGIASPFSCPFKELFVDWNGKLFESFFMLRDSKVLDELRKVLSLKKKIHQFELDENCLIPVKTQIMSNGAPGDFSILCMPNKKDIKFAQMTKFKNSSTFHENIHPDPNEQARKTKKFNHKKLLKRLKNRRVRQRRKMRGKFVKKANQEELLNLIKKQFKEMSELWLPKPISIRHQCSREVIGYVTKSRFTFSVGKVTSIGYVAAKAFKALIERFEKFKNVKPFVLIRSTKSTTYYTAKIYV